MTTPSASIAHYDRDAPGFGARYSRARFEDVHRDLLPFLPPPGSAVLDVGAGSGRDAAALSMRGYAVTAVEPSLELQAWSRDHFGPSPVQWVEDRLPSLQKLRSAERRYHFILCSAVLMHLAPAELGEAFRALAELLEPGGNLAISVRDRKSDDPPDIFHDFADSALFEAADAAGLSLEKSGASGDSLGRGHVQWRWFLFSDRNPAGNTP